MEYLSGFSDRLKSSSIKKRENLHDIIPDVPTEKRSNERRRCKFFHP